MFYAHFAEPIVTFYTHCDNAYNTSTVNHGIAVSSALDTSTYSVNGIKVTCNKSGTYNYSCSFIGSGFFGNYGVLYLYVNNNVVASKKTYMSVTTIDDKVYHEGTNYMNGSITLNSGDEVWFIYTTTQYHCAWVNCKITYTE